VTEPAHRASLPLLAALTALAPLGMHMMVPSLPFMARDLGVSPGSIQTVVTLYVFGLAVGQLVYGPLSDRFGRKPLIIIGLMLYSAAMTAGALAPGFGSLVPLRLAQSLGGCGALVLTRAMVRDTAAPAKAAGQMALINLSMSAASAIAPAIGGIITVHFGWRFIMGGLAAAGMIGLLVVIFRVPETHHNRVQIPSLAAMLGSFRRLLATPAFTGYVIGGACSTTALYGFLSVSPFLLIEYLHQPAEDVGYYYVLLAGGISAGSIVANRMASRVSILGMARIGSGVSVLAALALLAATLSGTLQVWNMIGSMTVYAIATGIASPNAATGAMSTDPQRIGAAAGLYGSLHMGFGAFCTAVTGVWHDGTALPVAVLLTVSSITGQLALMLLVRAPRKA
jgi:DHA1 family bicyclomycin/chloramphenicol resistance-like MFS transporter